MPKVDRTIAHRLEAAIAAVLLALALVGMALLPLTSPVYVRALVSLVNAEELTALSRPATLEAAEMVRRFVLDDDAPALPETIDGRPAFDASASSHLVDVRDVLLPARGVAGAAAVIAVSWLFARRKKRKLLGDAFQLAAWGLVSVAGLAAVIGLTDFDAFFAWFHSLFFAAGTWTFPADALLIQLFPLPFWMTAAASWAVLVFLGTGALFIFAHRFRFTARNIGV